MDETQVDEEYAAFDASPQAQKKAEERRNNWGNELLSANRQQRQLQKLAAISFGIVGVALVMISTCFAWRLFQFAWCAAYRGLSNPTAVEDFPGNGYFVLLVSLPIGVTMLAGVSIIAITARTIKTGNTSDSDDGLGSDAASALIKVVNQQ